MFWIESKAPKLCIYDWYPLTAFYSFERAECEAREMAKKFNRPYRVTDSDGNVLATFGE